jgi:hypothetical protein
MPVRAEWKWVRDQLSGGTPKRPARETGWRVRALGIMVLCCFWLGNNFGCQKHPMTYGDIGWKEERARKKPKDPKEPTEPSRAAYDDLRSLKDWVEKKGGGEAKPVSLITAKDLLEKFGKDYPKRRPASVKSDKPKLVLVAVSGGGIRASVWTGVVLEGLERELGDVKFAEHARIITGASGGMVGAAAYTARDRDANMTYGPVEINKVDKRKKQYLNPGLHPLAASLARDSLSPVVQTMLIRDFTYNALFPNRYEYDRGDTLEKAWDRNFTTPVRRWSEESELTVLQCKNSPFARPMSDLAQFERECSRPSLIFAPVMVEDTIRLLISNLDLAYLTKPKARRLDVKDDDVADELKGARLSQPAVEFFRLFPKSDKFTVGSAARMSASFPVVSPAVPIPTDPPRRVVDGGYYDNYGIDVLTNWLLHNEEFIEKHTSGVLIVHIRAYPLEMKGEEFTPESGGLLDKLIGPSARPLTRS